MTDTGWLPLLDSADGRLRLRGEKRDKRSVLDLDPDGFGRGNGQMTPRYWLRYELKLLTNSYGSLAIGNAMTSKPCIGAYDQR